MPRNMLRKAGRAMVLVTALAVAIPAVGVVTPAHSALANTEDPTLRLDRTLRTTPFAGSSVAMKDNEGSAYVARDNSLWLADDNGRMIYEVNPSTGKLKRSIGISAFAAVRRLGGGPQAGANRVLDLESMAYNAATDSLFVFSASCCTATVLPTVYRLTRQSGTLKLDSYQPLPTGSDFTAAAWNPGDGKLYVGRKEDLLSYRYSTNTVGPVFRVSNLNGILGITFSADGADLFVARSKTRLSRVTWATKSLVSGWTFDLSEFGMRDSRSVELVNDQFWVSDGFSRPKGDRLRFAGFMFDVPGWSPPAAAATRWTAAVASHGYPTTVRATLRHAKTGVAIGSHPVRAQVRWYGTKAWRSVGTKRATNSAGAVSYRHRTRRAGYFRFSLARSSAYKASTSTAVLVRVPSKLSATVKQGDRDMVKGTLTMAAGSGLKGKRVILQRRYAGHRGWVTVAKRTTNREGRVVSRQTPRRKVSYRWKYAGSTTTRPALSRSVSLRF